MEEAPYFRETETLPSAGIRYRHISRQELYFQWWVKDQIKKYLETFRQLSIPDSSEFIEPIVVSKGV